jgi:hypothetical protein
MSPELDAQLCAKYPKIFRDRHASMQETCMMWSLEIGDGWANIIDQLCHGIQWHIDGATKARESAIAYNTMKQQAKLGNWKLFDDYYNFLSTPDKIQSNKDRFLKSEAWVVPELIPQVVATQVKEKFGTLRFYYDGGDSVIEGMVYMAESMSGVTCEECGAPGTTGGRGYISTKCEAHKQK